MSLVDIGVLLHSEHLRVDVRSILAAHVSNDRPDLTALRSAPAVQNWASRVVTAWLAVLNLRDSKVDDAEFGMDMTVCRFGSCRRLTGFRLSACQSQETGTIDKRAILDNND